MQQLNSAASTPLCKYKKKKKKKSNKRLLIQNHMQQEHIESAQEQAIMPYESDQ